MEIIYWKRDVNGRLWTYGRLLIVCGGENFYLNKNQNLKLAIIMFRRIFFFFLFLITELLEFVLIVHKCLPEVALWVELIELKFDWMLQLSFKTIWHSLSVEVVDWLIRDWTSAASCFMNEARSWLSNSCSRCCCFCCCFCCCLCNKADDNRVLSISSTSERSKNS